ncbi:hypothetical protein DMC30DRAFT_418367, partial [Rhodotorula diobovata]
VKEDGLRAWLWSKKWLVLREHSLALYKNEGASTAPSTTIELADVTGVAREDLKPFCIAVTTAARPYYLALKSDEELRRVTMALGLAASVACGFRRACPLPISTGSFRF